MQELEFYTGTLTYMGIAFSFTFDKVELRLIPPTDRQREVRFTLLLKKFGDGPAYTSAFPVMEEPYLIGKCNETGQTIIFLTRQGTHIGSYNEVLSIKTIAYILCKVDEHPISKMAFTCPELDCVYPVTQGFSCTLDYDQMFSHGVFTIKTEDYEVTTTEKKAFEVDGKSVSV